MKRHRHHESYPKLWKMVDGAVRSAFAAHPTMTIENSASVTKRVVGQLLALEVGAATAADKGRGEFISARDGREPCVDHPAPEGRGDAIAARADRYGNDDQPAPINTKEAD